MSTIIQIKRSANVAAPSTTDLLEAELAYSQDKSNDGSGAILYIESLDSTNTEVIHKVGGKYYTDIVDGATDANTAGKLVKRNASGNFSANNISVSSNVSLNGTQLTGGGSGFFVDPIRNDDSGNVVYFNHITKELTFAPAGTASTADRITTARDIGLAGDLTGNVSFDGSQNVTLTATIAANSVALGTDTTGDYLSNVLAGTGINVTGQGGETATPTITLANTSVSAGHYGGATQVPSLTIDAQGRITSASNVSVSTAITLGADSGASDTLTNGDTLRVLGGTGIDTSVSDNTITVALETSGVTANTYGGSSSIPVFTVDATGRITAAANVAVAGVSNFTASGNTFTISTADGGTFSASIQENSVRLGTDTTGDYVSNVLAGTGVTITNQGGETATPTIAIGQSVATTANVTFNQANLTSANINGTTLTGGGSGFFVSPVAAGTTGNVVFYNTTTKELTFGAPASSSFTIIGDTGTDTFNTGDTLAIVGGTGVSTAATDNTITISNDGVLSVNTGYGLSTDASTGAITLNNTGVTEVISGGHGITVSSATGNVTVTNNGVTAVTGTANQIAVDSATGNIILSLPNNVTINNDLSVTGNLYVTGNVVAFPVENLVVEDSLIQLANNNIIADVIDIGFYGSYNGDGGEHEHAGLFRDASDGNFRLFQGLQGQGNLTSTVNISGTGYSVATLVANITGGTVSGLTSNIAVGDGGTGRGTLTTNAILFGQGTSQVGLATGTSGQVLQLNGSGVPVFAGLDGGSY